MVNGQISKRENGKRRYKEQKNKGLCGQLGCKNKPKEGFVSCEYHLKKYRDSKKKERKKYKILK